MKRNNTGRWLLVIFIVAWAIYEIYPPNDRDLLEVFQEQAVSEDAAFTNIVETTREMRGEGTVGTLGYLLQASQTNNLAAYFPNIDLSNTTETNLTILQELQKEAQGNIRLGIDLKGGTSFLLGMDTSALDSDTNSVNAAVERQAALSQAVEVLRKRVDKLGVAEPLLQPVGDNRILIQLPGLTEEAMENAKRQIEKAAFLEFRLVHERSAELLSEGIIYPGTELMTTTRTEKGQKVTDTYLVNKKPVTAMQGTNQVPLTGKYIRSAGFARDMTTGQPHIRFEFDNEGADLFAQVTEQNVGRQLAIILDGELASAPRINGAIRGGSGIIEGSFTEREAFELANVLENPLEAPVEILSEDRVGPSLGADSIASGVRAGIIGIIAVSVFMLVYYMYAGLVANAALVLNMIILMGVMCNIEATLTLPGLAGIVLTIGMAVDANVLIYERIREELKLGKSLRGAVSGGYDKAFSTIFDANITTLIASVILIFMGTGPVKGFGVTLTIGIVVSMFTALYVTRLFFDLAIERGWVKELKMLQFVKNPRIDFLKLTKPAFIASWLLIAVGVGYGLSRGDDILGHDFKGGTRMVFAFDEANKVDTDQLRAAIDDAIGQDALIQYQRDLGADQETLMITTGLIEDESGGEVSPSEEIAQALTNQFPQAQFDLTGESSVAGIVGKEIQRSAIISIVLALFGILIYVAFRYEFSFAIGAVVATIHDILMTLGIFFLAGGELSAPMVAAILTIIGFSINDTIVIFDRIREDLKLGIRGSFREIMTGALNQTLSRTLITSGTTAFAALSLHLFGGGVIHDLAFTFLVGVITGTYSSIYIACAVVLWWHKGKRPTLAENVVVDDSTVMAPAA